MEAEKVKEKAKRGENPALLNRSTSVGIIFFELLVLVVITSYGSVGVLPDPRFFYSASLIIGMSLSYLSISLGIIAIVKPAFRPIMMALCMAILCLIILLVYNSLMLIAVFGSWIFAPLSVILYFTPKIIFPLSLAIFVGFLIFKRDIFWEFFAAFSQRDVVLSLLFLAIFIWGHALSFEGDFYDEALEIEGKNYHIIIHYGWLGDPDAVSLYECQLGHFLCTMVFQSQPDDYSLQGTTLSYDESARVLQIENRGTVLYEHPIP